ncbi:MAG: hypothetical protein E6G13_05965 [Actinobacteria bacterium]|nr:MAG: hypothetical protein E6G13_05965 [Actinomycetota bacterium]
MRTILRLATVAVVAVSALAVAANAFATQKLAVTQAGNSLTIKVTQTANDAQPARINIYVPTGYTLNTAQTAGTSIGTTSGQVFARDQNIPLPLTGNVVVDDPAKYTASTCSPGTNQAVWLLNLSVAGQTLAIPVYVNPTSGAATGLGSAKLTVCLAPSDTPQGSPGRSPFGAQLLSATFTVNGVFTPAAGASAWTSLWTPYAAGNGIPNAAGTVEARAFVGPGAVTITGVVTSKRKRTVQIRGRVSYAGVGVVAATVRLLVNNKQRFSTSTASNGAYRFNLQKTARKKVTTFFQSRVVSAQRDVTTAGCSTPSVPGVSCVSATQGAFTVLSRKIKIRI